MNQPPDGGDHSGDHDPSDLQSPGSGGDEAPAHRPYLVRRGMWLVLGILGLSALLLAARNQLPAAPVMVLVIVGIGGVLWWIGDRGGRMRDRPVAAPVEAVGLILAVLGSIVVFWVVFGWLE